MGHKYGVTYTMSTRFSTACAEPQQALVVEGALGYDSPGMESVDPTPGTLHPLERRAFMAVIAGGLLAAPLVTEAQQAAKVARIGYLTTNLAENPQQEAFLQGLSDLGYIESRNLVIEYRSAEGKLERFSALAAELVALKVDVIVAASTPPALAAKQATRTIPVVFAAAADAVASGLVTSLAQPGGNVTGLSFLAPELVGKCLEAQAGRS